MIVFISILNQNTLAQNTTTSNTTNTSTATTQPTNYKNYDYKTATTEMNNYKNGVVTEQIKQQQATSLKENAAVHLAAETSQDENQKGSQIYQIAAAACELASGAFMTKYGASCTPKCNEAFLATSIFFAGAAKAASSQADSNSDVAHRSCLTAAQFSTKDSNCGPAPTPFKPSDVITKTFDQNGNCIGSQLDCDNLSKNLPPGTSIKDMMNGLKTITSGKGPYKINPDGSITSKDGKKYTVDNFSNENAMIAAGFSAADAKFAAANLKKIKDSINNDLSAASLLAKKNSGPNSYSDNTGTASNKSGSSPLTPNGSTAKLINDKERSLASAEGLVRDFNGEAIGISNDDIFRMMNRRYKLKASQDNFIAP